MKDKENRTNKEEDKLFEKSQNKIKCPNLEGQIQKELNNQEINEEKEKNK